MATKKVPKVSKGLNVLKPLSFFDKIKSYFTKENLVSLAKSAALVAAGYVSSHYSSGVGKVLSDCLAGLGS